MTRRLALSFLLLAAAAGAQEQERLRVAVYDAPGVGGAALDAAMAALHDLDAQRTRPEQIGDALDEARVVLFTGGQGSVQGRALGDAGRERVRRFVRDGGGYVGICAGAYLAMQGAPEFFKLGIVAAHNRTGDRWHRGIAPVRVRPSDRSAELELHYANGPILEAERVAGLAAFVTLARFESDLYWERYGTLPGEMRGTPAIAAASYGRGRIVLFSPNPTLEPAQSELLMQAVRWTAAGGPVPARLQFGDVFSRARASEPDAPPP